MSILAVVLGVMIVLVTVADLINTLVTTGTGRGRWWITVVMYTTTWRTLRTLGQRLSESRREHIYAMFAPVSVIAMLAAWAALQVIGFAFIWWGLAGVDGASSLFDHIYYSGVVYFTLGFGEIVPVEFVPRLGALFEAFSGVLTTALVIGYLPALYGAYSQREQQLLKLDDGTENRITPTNLVLARAPSGDPNDLEDFFAEWESWVAQVMETHTTFRMLVLFRSQHRGQNWITALGVVMDAALHVEMMQGYQGRSAYWLLRRGTRLLQNLTHDTDLTAKQAQLDEQLGSVEEAENKFFRPLYKALTDHGFPMLPYEQAFAHSQKLRDGYSTRLEFLIDGLDAPRGFWGHSIGHQLESPQFIAPE